MPLIRALALFACLTAAVALAAQQSLVCPAGDGSGRPCDRFHYHVQLYRPDTKQFFEQTAGDVFATQASCERARALQVAANAKVVEFHRSGKDQQYPEDRFGVCHCDLTNDKASVAFVSDAQRIAQRRMSAEIRMRVRERLMNRGMATDAEAIRALQTGIPSTTLLSGPKIVPMPRGAAAAPSALSTSDLQTTRGPEAARSSVAALELELVDLSGNRYVPPPEEAQLVRSPAAVATVEPVETSVEAPSDTIEATGEQTEVEATTADEPAPRPSSSADAAVESTVEPAPAEDDSSAQETAEQFVSYETQRIQKVLGAAGAIADESVKSRIFEACLQRIQLLTNLRLLIEGSGSRSRLAVAARDASTEAERLAFIASLFGSDITRHWAPQDAADVIVSFADHPDAEPEAILRDSAARFTQLQKKHALYELLAKSQPTEEQRLWLASVLESFLG